MATMTTPLTDRFLLSLKGRGERFVFWEPNRHGVGTLGVRVSAQGAKAFVYMYYQDGKARMMTLGRYPVMTVAEAHKAASDAMLAREQGADPAQVVVTENQRKRVAPTVEDLAEEYLEKWAKPRKRSWQEDERILNRDVLPALGKRKVEDVRRRDIVHLLDGIVARGSPIAANRTLAVVRKMFNFAITRDQIEHSPCTGAVAPARESRRDRMLSGDEVSSLLAALPATPMWTPTHLAILMVLLTAQRCGEVVGMTWAEVDLTGAWWTIPKQRAKNGLAHRVPLSPLALRLLGLAGRLNLGDGAVFPSRADSGPMVATAIARAVARNLPAFKCEPFTPHDLRRTAASHMTSIGISRLTVSKILNHAESGVTAIYDRNSYDVEKREALDRWALKLDEFGMTAALDQIEAKVGWHVDSKWWDKRKVRLETVEGVA